MHGTPCLPVRLQLSSLVFSCNQGQCFMGHLRQALMSFVKDPFKAATLSNLFPLEEKGVGINEHSPKGHVRAIY